ncbi:MAG: hypothetical protein SFV54_09775 [Bryobacteraceae bacterium]|nr:hypothetical protein [Bryobacteraceae bacterium]
MVAATALATDMLLIHNNAADFEMIRGSIEQNPCVSQDSGRCD